MDNTAIEPSEPAMTALMSLIVRHGGSLRVGPLLSLSGLAPGELRLLLSSLAERRRITIACGLGLATAFPGVCASSIASRSRWGRSRIPRQPRRPAIHPALLPRSSGRRRTMR
jgi:hypothetical protein